MASTSHKQYVKSPMWLPAPNSMAYDSVSFLRGAYEHVPISSEDQLKLVVKAKKGDNEALQALMLANLPFIIHRAKRYAGPTFSVGDGISLAILNFPKAVEKFDPSKGTLFLTYLGWWILQAIREGHWFYRDTVARIPRHLMTVNSKANRGIPLTPAELVYQKDANVVSGRVTPIHDLSEYLEPVSPYEQPEYDSETRIRMHQALNRMLPKDVTILKARFGLHPYSRIHTLKEVGKLLKPTLTRERVRQIQNNALERLKAIMDQILEE